MVFGKVRSLLIVFALRRNTGNCWMWEFRHLLDFVAWEINCVNMYLRVTKQVLLYSLPFCTKWIPPNVAAKLLYCLLLLEMPHYVEWNLIYFCAHLHLWIQWLLLVSICFLLLLNYSLFKCVEYTYIHFRRNLYINI